MPKKKVEKPALPAGVPERLTITQVAAVLKLRYQAARNLMLAGGLGPTRLEGHRLTVRAADVEKYAILKAADDRELQGIRDLARARAS